jgi:hypothetical protein
LRVFGCPLSVSMMLPCSSTVMGSKGEPLAKMTRPSENLQTTTDEYESDAWLH